MAALATLPELLRSIQQSVDTVSESTTTLSGLAPPAEGLSLLDVKNELLLSYLEHMVFLILLKLQNSSDDGDDGDNDRETNKHLLASSPLGQATVSKLVQLRLYLEKGVRPLEDKLRYQIEKALRAAETAERAAQKSVEEDEDDDDSDEDEEDEESDEESDNNHDLNKTAALIFHDSLAETSRPNRAAFVRPAARLSGPSGPSGPSVPPGVSAASAAAGVYRPPKIAPVMMPATASERRERAERRPFKSATLDEFLADEFSTAPVAQPSIGTNIAQGGRHMKTTSEREKEAERREYEERNFVRLPKASKKERAKQARAEGGGSGRDSMAFGGEDWRGLGEGVDRINRLTQRKSGSGSGAGSTRALLEKSRKRGIDTIDGPRGSGQNGHGGGVGDRFEKRLRLQNQRDRKKKR